MITTNSLRYACVLVKYPERHSHWMLCTSKLAKTLDDVKCSSDLCIDAYHSICMAIFLCTTTVSSFLSKYVYHFIYQLSLLAGR